MSCGCVWKANLAKGGYLHGYSKHPLQHTWADIKGRCTCKTNKSYPYYGGRGITLCDEWYDNCKNFIEWGTSHGWEPGLTIERIDVDGPYSPDNCKWATRFEQANNMRSNHLLTYNGKTQNIAQWARELGVSDKMLRARIKNGWSVERTLTEPKRPWPESHSPRPKQQQSDR